MMFIKQIVEPDSIFEQTSKKPAFLHRLPLKAFTILSVSIFCFCFIVSPLNAQIPSVRLSPTDLLMPYLEQAREDSNRPVVQKQDTKIGTTDLLMPFLERALRHEETAAVKMHYANIGSVLQDGPQTVDAETVNHAVETEQELPRILSAVPAGINNPLGRQLWRAGIGFYKDQSEGSGKSELKLLIEQIRALEVRPPEHHSESVIKIGPVPSPEPNEMQTDIDLTENTSKETVKFTQPYEPVSDRTLQMLADSSLDPNQMDNPFGLGEILYCSGRLREAVPFYRQALNRIEKDESPSEQNRAWILFQLGNCLRDYDLPAAKKMYVQLITEYPESTWVDLAKVWDKLIDLYLKDDPKKLIAER